LGISKILNNNSSKVSYKKTYWRQGMMSTGQIVSALRLLPMLAAIVAAPASQAVSGGTIERLNPNDFKHWVLPETQPQPEDNKMTPARIELARQLWFDARLSGNGTKSCATCHSPTAGWGDGEALSLGMDGKPLARHAPTIVNIGYNTSHSWDGRAATLETQIPPVLKNPNVMGTDLDKLLAWMNQERTYKPAFDKAYPGEPIDVTTLSKAIASFERSVISRDSPFDRWVAGDPKALTAAQKCGMALFMDRNKTNCVACHSAPNFMDNGFHNIGLAQFGTENPDVGRLLMDVVEHYAKEGVVRTNLSPNIKPLDLTQSEKEDD
jgi:cytochrome c peroxidase